MDIKWFLCFCLFLKLQLIQNSVNLFNVVENQTLILNIKTTTKNCSKLYLITWKRETNHHQQQIVLYDCQNFNTKITEPFKKRVNFNSTFFNLTLLNVTSNDSGKYTVILTDNNGDEESENNRQSI